MTIVVFSKANYLFFIFLLPNINSSQNLAYWVHLVMLLEMFYPRLLSIHCHRLHHHVKCLCRLLMWYFKNNLHTFQQLFKQLINIYMHLPINWIGLFLMNFQRSKHVQSPTLLFMEHLLQTLHILLLNVWKERESDTSYTDGTGHSSTFFVTDKQNSATWTPFYSADLLNLMYEVRSPG